MQSKSVSYIFRAALGAMFLLAVSSVFPAELTVPEVFQEQGNWCWAACSQAVLEYYGTSVSQCQIVNYTRVQAAWGDDDCCVTPSGAVCNQANWEDWYPGSIKDILSHWSVDSQSHTNAFTKNEVTTEINNCRPFIIFWEWTGGGGHFLVGRGINDNTVHYMNPGAGEGYSTASYDWVVSSSDHNWTRTLEITTSHECGAIAAMDFENGTDGAPIRSTIPGMIFTTTQGYDWIYGDIRTGNYNVYPYGSAAYYCQGNVFAWLGPNQGQGRIDFTGATAKSISAKTSSYATLYMEAHNASGQLIDIDQTPGNLNTNTMGQVTVTGTDIAYVLIHDAGNYWLIDDLVVVDLLRLTEAMLPGGYALLLEILHTINPGVVDSYIVLVSEVAQELVMLLNWSGSELKLTLRDPNGELYGEWQTDKPPIRIDIANAMAGEWQAEVTAIDIPHNDYPYALVVGSLQSTSADISGSVIANNAGLTGVKVDLKENAESSYSSTYTDADGHYEFLDVLSGEYIVEIEIPLGFFPISEPSMPIAISGQDVGVDFELTVSATNDPCANFWWWQKQFKYIQMGGAYAALAEITHADIEKYSTAIFKHFYNRTDNNAIQIESASYTANPPRALTFNELSEIFLAPYENTCDFQTLRSIRTNLLNIASGRMSQLKIVSDDGASASQALTYLIGLYLTGQRDNVNIANACLQRMHVNIMIPAGIIPLSTPNIMYKPEHEEQTNQLPTKYGLSQNYPNPFNPFTEISFSLPRASDVDITIYNITGQKVAMLADNHFEAGTYSCKWDGTSFASGIYFYRIRIGEYTETRKMMLLK